MNAKKYYYFRFIIVFLLVSLSISCEEKSPINDDSKPITWEKTMVLDWMK